MIMTKSFVNFKNTLFLGLSLLTVFSFVFLPQFAEAVEKVPFVTFAEKAKLEPIENITIRGNNLEIVFKNGERLYSEKEQGVSLSESLLKYGVGPEKLRETKVEIGSEGFLDSLGIFFPVVLPIGIYIAWFLIIYLVALGGLKLFKIDGVPRYKIVVFIFLVYFLGLLLHYANGLFIQNATSIYTVYFINSAISLLATFLIFKYYLQLAGKKLWYFLIFLSSFNILFSIILTFSQRA